MFSIVIPTFNRPAQLASCLQSFNRQALDRARWEVVVIDDGSSIPAKEKIERLSLNFTWRCHRQENAGPATARNFGAELATGCYLVFIDDDCEMDEKFLLVLAAVIRPRTLTGGLVINKLRQNLFAEASQSLLRYLYAALHGTPMMFFTTNNFAIERQAFLECGGFSTAFRTAAGEDREFGPVKNFV